MEFEAYLLHIFAELNDYYYYYLFIIINDECTLPINRFLSDNSFFAFDSIQYFYP